MSRIFKTLSQLLDVERSLLTADDLAALTECERSALLDEKLLVPTRPATHVTCDACHGDHVEEVTRIKDAKGVVSYRLHCPDSGWVDVPEVRRRQWTVDFRRLMTVLSAALKGSPPPEELVRASAWRLGIIEIAGESYDVVFVLASGPAHTPSLDELARKHPPARTVLVAARELPDATNRFAAALLLPEAFMFSRSRVEFHIGRVRSIISGGSTVNGNVFQLRGEFWQLSFNGKTTFLKDSVGMGYIARLLMEPKASVPAVTLLAARAGIDPLVTTGSSGEVLDDEAREKYAKRYRELLEVLDEASDNNDLGEIEKLECEMEALMNELACATGLGGRSRQKSDTEKIRKSVSMAVSRDIERIGKHHQRLGMHLTTTITSGLVFRYDPGCDTEWLT